MSCVFSHCRRGGVVTIENAQPGVRSRTNRASTALAAVRASVRHLAVDGLAKLPPAERAAWGAFWAEVEKLLKLGR